jgi:glycosyl transferase family 25
MNNPRTNTFVLNLDRSTDRMEWMAAQLEAFGMPYQRVAGIDGARDDLDAAMRSLGVRLSEPSGRSLAKTEIGCYLSHLTAIRRALAQDCAAALILEDDAQILADISSVLDDFAQYQNSPYLLRLEPWHKAHWQASVANLADVEALYMPDDVMFFCTGYCLTRAAMTRVITAATDIRRPIDLDIYQSFGLTVLMTSPPLVGRSKTRFESLIRAERKQISGRPSRSKRLRQRLIRRYAVVLALTRVIRVARKTAQRFGTLSILSLRLRSHHGLTEGGV